VWKGLWGRKIDWNGEEMAMKCPICGSQLSETSLKRFKRGLGVLAILVIVIVLALMAYWVLYGPNRVDLSHDVLFLMPNTLASSVLQDGSGSSGGIVAIYGNISNDASWSIKPLVVIEVNESSTLMHFYVHAGLVDPDASEYFSWAYHFDDLNALSTNVTLRVWGS
jgi:hypothetical protein